MSSPRDLFNLIGTTIAGKFRVERVLGEGGFGVVYAGTHVMLGEKVAIKCLKPLGFTPEDRERGAQSFLREGRILFGLGHPAIVRLYDVGVIDEGQIPYVVLELLTGTTLEAEIRERAGMRRQYGKDELATLFLPILEAVSFAHERGIVHRDLKPSNIMLVTDAGRLQPKVLDFGTARADNVGTGRAGVPAPDASLGKTGFTPLYAAPEQWDAVYGATGPRTDVFALGLMIAEVCLLGYPMDIGGANAGILSVFKASLDDSSRPLLAQARPDLPADLERVVLRAMRARGEQRYADARELLSAFRSALKVAPSTAPLAAPLQMSPPVGSAPPQAPSPPGYGSSPSGYGPPPQQPLPMYAPMMMGASTTQGQALATYGSAPTPPRSSALPWVIGIVGLLVAILMVGIGVIVAVVLPSSSTPTTAAPTPPTTKVAGAPTTAPPTIVTPPAGKVATGPTPRLILGSAIGTTPFWSQAEVMDVGRQHQAEMINCGREALSVAPKLEGDIDIIVSPDKSGVVESVQCSMRIPGVTGHNNAGETAMCACVESTIGKWRFPAAHGKLGLLDSGPFIYDYKLFPP